MHQRTEWKTHNTTHDASRPSQNRTLCPPPVSPPTPPQALRQDPRRPVRRSAGAPRAANAAPAHTWAEGPRPRGATAAAAATTTTSATMTTAAAASAHAPPPPRGRAPQRCRSASRATRSSSGLQCGSTWPCPRAAGPRPGASRRRGRSWPRGGRRAGRRRRPRSRGAGTACTRC